MRAYEFLVEGYPEAQAEFTQASGDANTAKQSIDQFRSLVNKNQVQGNERNIDWWRKQGWEPFSKFVVQKAQQPTKTQVKRQRVAGRSVTLMENDQWLIVIPLDKEASCFHGKNSDWCTTKPMQPYFENYFYDRGVTLIYCLQKQTGGMWAIAAHRKLEDKFEIFDQQDRSISESEFFAQTQLSARKIIEVALGDTHQPEVEQSRVGYKDSVALTGKLMIETMKPGERSQEIEQQLLYNKNPDMCEAYITKLLNIVLPIHTGLRGREGEVEADFLPEAIILSALQSTGMLIKLIKNPTERQQLAVVQTEGDNIQFINNPTLKVQLAALEQDLSTINYIQNPDPAIFDKYPDLKNFLQFTSDEVWKTILPEIAEYVHQAVDEKLFEWEADDDSFRDWQYEQAVERGYTDEDGEVDWDRVHEDDDLNNYYEYNSDAGYIARDADSFAKELQDPTNIIEWANEMLEDNALYPEDMTIESLDSIIAWKLKRQGWDHTGDVIAKQIKNSLLISVKDDGKMPTVHWVNR